MDGVPLLEKSPHTNGTRRKNRSRPIKYEYDEEEEGGGYFEDAVESYEIEDSLGINVERRPVRSTAFRYLMFCFGILFFLMLMYIPAYRQVNRQFGVIQGWSANTSRDTRTYVRPDNITILNQPTKVCGGGSDNPDDKLLLLIVVCSATENFARRRAIRETWADRAAYDNLRRLFDKVMNSSGSLEVMSKNGAIEANVNLRVRNKRQLMSGLRKLNIPELEEALNENAFFNKKANTLEEENFATEGTDPRFDFGSENGGINRPTPAKTLLKTYEEPSPEYDDYGTEKSNIMKIPPRGYEDSIDIDSIMANLKKQNLEMVSQHGKHVDFKVVFLLGLPQNDNTSEIQSKIDQELMEYGDIIQEGFIDTYNNLTLKSVMLLKWVNTQCNNVQYIMKTDDDMFVNVPNLVKDLKNKTFLCPSTRAKQKAVEAAKSETNEQELLLMGVVFCGARPILDPSNKWYSPRYMYQGRVYPCYLSGTGYVMSAAVAKELYMAALDTPLFHLEDVYITGMCAQKAGIKPIQHYGFSHLNRADSVCELYSSITAHGAVPYSMRTGITMLSNITTLHRCEKKRLIAKKINLEKSKKSPHKFKYVRKTCI